MSSTSEALDSDCGEGLRRLDGRFQPAWLGLAIAITWPGIVALAYAVANRLVVPDPVPFTPARFALTVLANGALLGLVVAGKVSLKRAVAEDLRKLRPIIPASSGDLDRLATDIANLSRPVSRIATMIGLLGGLAVATLDPGLRDLYGHLSPWDPRYVVFVTQNVLFAVLVTQLFATELHMTRAYARLGERIEVDLLDTSTVLVFGRKGLRSVILWVSISMVFSMFWLLDSAGQANGGLAALVLGLVIVALVAPTSGVRRSIASAKARELAIVSQAIREERDAALSSRREQAWADDARLGNLIQYHAFVKSIREWPFDLSIVSRSSLFIALGVGSWLGGAVVERLLTLILD